MVRSQPRRKQQRGEFTILPNRVQFYHSRPANGQSAASLARLKPGWQQITGAGRKLTVTLHNDLRKGTLAELTACMEEALANSLSEGTRNRYADNWRTLEEFRRLRSMPTDRPIEYDEFGLFAAWWVRIRCNCAHTLNHMLSTFKTVSLLRYGRFGWTEEQRALASRLIKGFMHQYPQGTKHKKALRFPQLRDMGRQLGTIASGFGAITAVHRLTAEMYWLLFNMLHQGMMRGGEAGLLLVRDVVFLTRDGCEATTLEEACGVAIRIRNSKTGKLTDEAQVVYIARRYDEFDVVRPLAQYMLAHGLLAPGTANARLFCHLDGKGVRTDRVIRREDIQAMVQRVLRESGYPSAEASGYTGHSFRAGGATDAHLSGMPLELIIQQGRWKSDAWRIYQRPSPNVVHQWAQWRPVQEVVEMKLPWSA